MDPTPLSAASSTPEITPALAEKTLYLLDISSFIFRAFYAIRALSSPKGEPTNAIYGVAQMVHKLMEVAQPHHLVVCNDNKEASFRKEIDAQYKANRSAPPDDLIPQFARVDQLVELLKIPAFRVARYEADDLIATLTRLWIQESPQHRVVIVTGDKDLMQLVGQRVWLWDTMASKVYGEKEVEEKLGVHPTRVRDYLTLVGDSSDNVPGVPGVGPKTAAQLLAEFGTLESIVEAAKKGEIKGKKAESLLASETRMELSRQLVSLMAEVPLTTDLIHKPYQFQGSPELVAFAEELGLHSLAKKWGGKSAAPVPVGGTSGAQASLLPADTTATDGVGVAAATANALLGYTPNFRSVLLESEFQALCQQIEARKEFIFDLETTSLNPREAQIVGIAIGLDTETGYYIPIGHISEGSEKQLPADRVLARLRTYFEDPRYKKIGQNLKYDISVLACLGIEVRGIGADTMVASYVLDPASRHGLDYLCERYLGYKTLTFEEVCGKGKDQIGFAQVAVDVATRYAAEDAWCTSVLWEKFKKLIAEEKLLEIFSRVDLPLVKVLSKMELYGVTIDVPWMQQLAEDFRKELALLEERIQSFSQKPINLNSPKQLGPFLFEELGLPEQGRTKTGYSTDAQVLEILSPLHEVPRLLLEYREISKLLSTYVEPLPTLIDPKTGRIHASFHQTVAATGRLSSSDPNLQNIPTRSERGRRIRHGFIASEGRVLLSVDYSQIELRILAGLSGDPELCRSFSIGEDVHRRTAGEIFHKTLEEVTESEREIAKAINFGLMYGKTVFGLAQELGIPRGQAKEMIERYFERYRAVKDFLTRQVEEAREKGYVRTALGRKRALPEVQSKNGAIRANGERMAMNSPIQGTAADLMKLAMIEIDGILEDKKFRSRLMIQVHDEFVLECPPDEVEQVTQEVVRVMENVVEFPVPLKVNTSIGQRWDEL